MLKSEQISVQKAFLSVSTKKKKTYNTEEVTGGCKVLRSNYSLISLVFINSSFFKGILRGRCCYTHFIRTQVKEIAWPSWYGEDSDSDLFKDSGICASFAYPFSYSSILWRFRGPPEKKQIERRHSDKAHQLIGTWEGQARLVCSRWRRPRLGWSAADEEGQG